MALISSTNILIVIIACFVYTNFNSVPSAYQVQTSMAGVYRLLHLPQEQIDKCVAAYQFFQRKSDFSERDQLVETEHVKNYYTVVNEILAVADIEAMYIPPQVDAKQGLFQNQIIWERMVADSLNLRDPTSEARLLDVGCGRGRISHRIASYIGGKVDGFNIDSNQVQNAIEHAEKTGLKDRLSFQIGDHHKPFNYSDNSFDGSYSFQAIWPFFVKEELDDVSRELYRVLKPGSRYSCSEYLLTRDFDKNNDYHIRLHKLFLPTLAATQSNYADDVVASLERAGFKVIYSRPSIAPAWPLCDDKTDMFLLLRRIVILFTSMGIMPAWVETLCTQFLLGGQAWNEAEKSKIADLNWQIVAEKPSAH